MVTDYLKYLFRSSSTPSHLSALENRIVKVIKNRQRVFDDKYIVQRLADLKSSDERLVVQDFGAGSKQSKGNTRKVKTIAKYASIKPKYGQLYAALISDLNIENAIELGTSFGIGTSYLASAAKKVITMEGCPNTAIIASNTFALLKLSNIDLKIGEFSDLLANTDFPLDKPLLVYIDGNHQMNPTLEYFDYFRGILPENSILIFDDIYWSEGMKCAWSTICKAPYFTIDLFQIGMVLLTKREAPLNLRKRF